jgi:hypothetical protein
MEETEEELEEMPPLPSEGEDWVGNEPEVEVEIASEVPSPKGSCFKEDQAGA